MSRTYRDRPRRLVKEDARRAGFVTICGRTGRFHAT